MDNSIWDNKITTAHPSDQRMFYLVFSIWYLMENITITNFKSLFGIPVSTLDKYVSYLVLGLLIIYILFYNQYKKSEIILISLVSAIIVLTTINSQSNHMIALWIFLVSSKNIDFRKVISIAYYVTMWVLIITVMASIVGMIPDYTMHRGSFVRHSLGYGHVNVLGMKVFQAEIYYLLLNFRKRNKILFIYMMIVFAALFVYYIPNSKTPVVLSVLLCVLFSIYLILHNNYYQKTVFMVGMIFGSCMANVLSLFFCIGDFSGVGYYKVLNRLLSSRFSLSHKAYLDFGTSWFGQTVYISFIERKNAGLSGYYFLDNTYMIILIRYGIVFYLIFSIAYIASMIIGLKTEKYMMVLVLFIYSIYGLMEPSMYRFSYNITLLYLGGVIFGKVHISDENVLLKRKVVFTSGKYRKLQQV